MDSKLWSARRISNELTKMCYMFENGVTVCKEALDFSSKGALSEGAVASSVQNSVSENARSVRALIKVSIRKVSMLKDQH